MKIDTRIDDIMNIRCHIIKGRLKPEEVFDLLDGLFNLNDNQIDMNACWNLMNSDLSELKSGHVKAFANKIINILSNREEKKIALIVGSNFPFGMARMLEILIEEDYKGLFNIFLNEKEAYAWLREL